MTYGRHPDCVSDDDTDIECILGAHARALSEAGEVDEILTYLYEARFQLNTLLRGIPEGQWHLFANVVELAKQADHLHDHVERRLREYRRAA